MYLGGNKYHLTKGVAKTTDTAEAPKWNEKWTTVKRAICNQSLIWVGSQFKNQETRQGNRYFQISKVRKFEMG